MRDARFNSLDGQIELLVAAVPCDQYVIGSVSAGESSFDTEWIMFHEKVPHLSLAAEL